MKQALLSLLLCLLAGCAATGGGHSVNNNTFASTLGNEPSIQVDPSFTYLGEATDLFRVTDSGAPHTRRKVCQLFYRAADGVTVDDVITIESISVDNKATFSAEIFRRDKQIEVGVERIAEASYQYRVGVDGTNPNYYIEKFMMEKGLIPPGFILSLDKGTHAAQGRIFGVGYAVRIASLEGWKDKPLSPEKQAQIEKLKSDYARSIVFTD